MADIKDSPQPTEQEARQERLNKALRDNLRKRKQQQRARSVSQNNRISDDNHRTGIKDG